MIFPRSGYELGKPRPAATVVAPTLDGAGAHAHYEPTASGGTERRLTLQKEVVAGKGQKQLEAIRLAPWANRRREDLLKLLDGLNPTIAELTQAIDQEVEKSAEARRLMTHPSVGPLTALAFVLIIGKPNAFSVASRSRRIEGYPWRIPVATGVGWDISPSKATRCCASCWWSRRR